MSISKNGIEIIPKKYSKLRCELFAISKVIHINFDSEFLMKNTIWDLR